MILIADSGSTKTDWRLIDSLRNIYQFSTIGFNPYFQDIETIAAEIRNTLLPKVRILSLEEFNKSNLFIYFYGAGCSSPEKSEVVKSAIQQNFPNATIEVQHDLLAAARVLFGKNKGIAAILGTGSNSCYFDGEKVVDNISSLGFILGDEGSGAYIGKLFMQDYLNNDLPKKIHDDFYATYKLSKEKVFNSIYTGPMPSRFLASFNKFIYRNQEEKYINDLIVHSFNQFFNKHICKYPNHQDVKVGCVGSVAYYYQNILRYIATQRGIFLDKIIESPISGLTLFHLQKEPMHALL